MSRERSCTSAGGAPAGAGVTCSGHFSSGHDFKGTMSGTLSIAAGERQGVIKLTVFPHSGSAANKTLKVVLNSLVGSTGSKIVRATGVGTLINP